MIVAHGRGKINVVIIAWVCHELLSLDEWWLWVCDVSRGKIRMFPLEKSDATIGLNHSPWPL